MNKKFIIIIAIIIVILIFTYKKLSPMMAAKQAFLKAKKAFDPSIVENAEKIYRLETANFTSGQFLGTFSPGMEPVTSSYPYGWSSLRPFWDERGGYKPIGIKTYTENETGIKKNFIQFASVEAGIFTLCKFIELTGNNPGRWFSTQPDLQIAYENKLINIQTPYTNEG